MKSRIDAKLNKQIIRRAMSNYAKYGSNSSYTNILSKQELDSLTSVELLELIHNLTSYNHKITYYGPEKITSVVSDLKNLHISQSNLTSIPVKKDFAELDMEKARIYVVDYDMKQAEIIIQSKGEKLDIDKYAEITFHNEYFGGGMSSIVFQEMRESKALAYSVYSTYTLPRDTNTSHYLMSYIGTQADKLSEAMLGMFELLNVMPEAESNMKNAKEAIEQKIRTERLTRSRVLSEYEKAYKLGINHDVRKDLYKAVQDFDIASLKDFHDSHISSGTRIIMVLGSKDNLDLDALEEYGQIKHLTLKDVFGY